MGMITAPYNNAMRLGCGFNSFTQSLCVNDAVLKDNRKPATEETLRVVEGETSQIVTYTATFVEHASEVLKAMNIKGSVSIKLDGLGDGAISGSYLNTEQMKGSDINYLIQVKVINQKLVSDDLSRFNAIPNLPASSFTDTYGDTFISGFVEGGEFYALLSITLNDSDKNTTIDADLSIGMDKGIIKGQVTAKGGYQDHEMAKNSTTAISVSWSGGGQIRPKEDVGTDWTLEKMKRAANGFPEKVAVNPQRTHAILTKYNALRSYQELTNKGTPLDYEKAGVYTNALLDAYMDYKDIWKTIQSLSSAVSLDQILRMADDNDIEYYEYAKEAQADYIRKVKAYYYPDMSIASFEQASMPAPPKSITNGTNDSMSAPSMSIVKGSIDPGSNDHLEVAPISDQKDDLERQLALVNHDIIVAKKKLLVFAKGESSEPPLKPNKLKRYSPSLLGLDQARRDCRWEMIKIVKEVDAVTIEPSVATDTSRVWQYLNPAVFRQLLPRLVNHPPPYPLSEWNGKLDEIKARDKEITDLKDNQAKAIAAAITEKLAEIADLNSQIDQIKQKAQQDQEKAVADVMVQVNDLKKQIEDLQVKARALETAIADRQTLQKAYDDMNGKFNSFQQSNAQYTESLVKAVERVENDLNPTNGLRPDAVAPYYGEVSNQEVSIGGAKNTSVEYAIVFSKPFSYTPRILTGLCTIDTETLTPFQGPGVTVYNSKISKEGISVVRGTGEARSWSVDAWWMTLPENGIQMDTGVVDAAGIVRSITVAAPFKLDIKFTKPFSKGPVVHVWIQAVDWECPGLWKRLEVNASNISSTGCTININTWNDTIIRSARVAWIAYDVDQQNKRIKSKEVSIDSGSRLKLPIRSNVEFNTITFEGDRFSRTPGMFTALARIDVNPSFGFRTLCKIQNVKQESFEYALQTWYDSEINAVRAVWIAMD